MDAWSQTENPTRHDDSSKTDAVKSPSRRGRASTIQADPDQVRTTTVRLSEENIIYCNLMSKTLQGSSMSGYINMLIEKDRLAHPKESNKARKILQIQMQ